MGFNLSRNDVKVVLYGQLLTVVTDASELDTVAVRVEEVLDSVQDTSPSRRQEPAQHLLFELTG